MKDSAGPGSLLNARQARFVEEYLVDLIATQAAIRAGYSEKTAEQQGNRLLGIAKVAAAIAEAQASRSKRVGVTQDYVISSIVETMERCKQAEAVTDRQGEPVMVETPTGDLAPAYTFNAMGVFKGAELLGKHLGMFVDRLEHTGKGGGPIQTEEASARERILSSLTRMSARSGAGSDTGEPE